VANGENAELAEELFERVRNWYHPLAVASIRAPIRRQGRRPQGGLLQGRVSLGSGRVGTLNGRGRDITGP
jgi:hypothetical protein